MKTHAVVLGGGGIAGVAWETGVLVGLADAGIDARTADLFVGTSAGASVAAQITSGLTFDELFQRLVDPTRQTLELTVQPDFGQMLADFSHAFEQGGTSEEILQRIGALALAVPTLPEAQRREVVASRLPVHRWPQSRIEIVAVDILSGQRAIFTRESGVELVDAVMASGALPYAWPPATIHQRRYMDGGCYSIANLDRAAGYDRVLLLQPEVPPFSFIETLDEQIARLQQQGCQIAAITPDEAMKAALASVGGNPLDPSLRASAASAGREQGRREAARVASLWA